MKFMVTWKIPTGSYQTAIEAYLKTGAPPPAGVTNLGRYHSPGSATGWILVEGDAEAVASSVAEWSGLAVLEAHPVIEDAEATSSLARVYGKKKRAPRKRARKS